MDPSNSCLSTTTIFHVHDYGRKSRKSNGKLVVWVGFLGIQIWVPLRKKQQSLSQVDPQESKPPGPKAPSNH